MSTENDRKAFSAEFAALKKKYGKEFADLQAVRFQIKKSPLSREFTPYWCRLTDDGDINCEEERPI